MVWHSWPIDHSLGWHGSGIRHCTVGVAILPLMLGMLLLLMPATCMATPAAATLHRELTYRDAPDIRYLREPQFSEQETAPPAPSATEVRRVPSTAGQQAYDNRAWSIPISRSPLLDLIHLAALGTFVCLWWAWSRNTP
jgi:hypothetical protein